MPLTPSHATDPKSCHILTAKPVKPEADMSMTLPGTVAQEESGVVGVFELAAQMSPDVIFLISDAGFQWKEDGELSDVPWKEIEKIVKGRLQSAEGCVLNLSASR